MNGGRAFPGMTCPKRTTGAVAIEHVALVPMDNNRLVRDQMVVFEDGTIRRIDVSSNVQLENVRRIDGRGHYLMPGLADMRVHYWDPTEFGLFLANGVTRVRNMWGAPMHLALRQQLDAGLLPGPHVTTTSPLIDGPGDNGKRSGLDRHCSRDPRKRSTWCARSPSGVTSRSRLTSGCASTRCARYASPPDATDCESPATRCGPFGSGLARGLAWSAPSTSWKRRSASKPGQLRGAVLRAIKWR
jgi:hypothetical protein